MSMNDRNWSDMLEIQLNMAFPSVRRGGGCGAVGAEQIVDQTADAWEENARRVSVTV